MKWLRFGLVVPLAAASVACGGSTTSDTGSIVNGGVAGASAGGSGGVSASDCRVGDVAFCGFGSMCPDDCTNGGCAPTYDDDGKPATGICQDTSYFQHAALCFVCREGDVCYRAADTPQGIECVERALCLKKLALGQSGCFFSDKSQLTSDPIPDPDACPSATLAPFCGGACGSCPAGLTCTGRSPTHPVGLCLEFTTVTQPTAVETCTYGEKCPAAGSGCFIYDDGASYTAIAKSFGLCFPLDECKEIATLIPGGGACLDDTGAVVAGSL